MTLHEINNKISEIGSFLEQWEAQGYTPTIEKRSVLHKLQEVYDALSNSKAVPTDCPDGICLDINFTPLQPQQQVFDDKTPTPNTSCAKSVEQPEKLEMQNEPTALILPSEFKEEPKREEKTASPAQNNETVLILGQKISIEQKDIYTNELFWRDETFFANEIRKFQLLDSLDEALIYIGEKYNWSANNMYAEQFISMLENYYK